MRVSCPSCGTEQDIAPGQALPGNRVRCKRCGVNYVPEAAGGGKLPAGGRSLDSTARTAFDDLQAADADESGELSDLPDDAYGAAPGHAAATPVSELFGELEVDEPEAPEASQPVSIPEPTPTPAGLSRIRAQTQAVPIARLFDDGPKDDSGWLARTEDGQVQTFRDLDAVRAWLAANPGTSVDLSSDGRTWRPPEAILGLDESSFATPDRPSVALDITPTGPSPTVADPTKRRRLKAVQPPAGPGWWSAVALSTVVFVLVAVVAAQTLGVTDLGETLPFDAVGLGDIAVGAARPVIGTPPPQAPEAPSTPLTPKRDSQAAYEEAIVSARSAQERGRYVDAAVAYRRALSYHESPEALEGLGDAYELLGEARRAKEVRRRLEDVRNRVTGDEP